jgi:hypothetical protein
MELHEVIPVRERRDTNNVSYLSKMVSGFSNGVSRALAQKAQLTLKENGRNPGEGPGNDRGRPSQRPTPEELPDAVFRTRPFSRREQRSND